MKLGRIALHGAGWSTAGASLGGVLQLLQLVVLARLLSAEDYGLAAMTAIPLGIATVFADAGISNILVVRQSLTQKELSSLYWLNWIACSAMFLIMYAGAPWLASIYGEERLEPLVRWSSITFLVVPIGQQFQFLMQKELRFRQVALTDFAGVLVGVLTSIFAALAGYGALSLILGGVVTALVRSVAFAALGWKAGAMVKHFSWLDVRPHLAFGSYQLGERLLNFIAWNIDKILISALLGPVALGYYNMAYQLAQRPLTILQPVLSRVVLPVFAKVGNDTGRLNRGYLLVVRGLAIGLFPLYFGVAILAEDLIQLMLGPRWLPAAPVLVWLALLHCFYAIGPAIGPYLLARHRADMAFWMNVWAIFLYFVAVAIGARYSAEGVAIALLMATAGGLFTLGFWVRWQLTAMQPGAFIATLMPGLVSASIACLVTQFILKQVSQIVSVVPSIHLAIGVVIGAGMYCIALALLFRSPVVEILEAVDLRIPSRLGNPT